MLVSGVCPIKTELRELSPLICTRARFNASAAARIVDADDDESDPAAAEPSLAKRVLRFLALSAEWLGRSSAHGIFDRDPHDALGE